METGDTSALGLEGTLGKYLMFAINPPHAPPSPDCGRRVGDEGKMNAWSDPHASSQTPVPSPQPLSRDRERG